MRYTPRLPLALTLLVMSVVPVLRVAAAQAPGVADATSQDVIGAIDGLVAPQDPAERGRFFFVEADRRESGYVDLQVSLNMVLRSASGREAQRALRIRQLEVPTDADKVLVVFESPANIRGTALLSHGHIEGDDDQWLFLPAIKRAKKIASRNKSGPFVGSEFAFEDLSPRDVSQYDYLYIAAETYRDLPMHVIERVPHDPYSGYSKQRVWLDETHLRIFRIDYYNRREEVIKTLDIGEYALHDGRFWKPAYMRMNNLRTGKSTDLIWRDYEFGLGLIAERDFSVASLRRVR